MSPRTLRALAAFAAAALAAVPARASLLDQLKAQADASQSAPAVPTASGGAAAAPATPDAVPLDVTKVVAADGTDVFAQPREPAASDEAAYEKALVAQLRRGESVKVLGQIPGWSQVEINRRDWNETTGAWEKSKGWVATSALADGIADLAPQTKAEAVFDVAPAFVPLTPDACRDAFLQKLKGFVGTPYVWGGTSHRGVDCSGLVISSLLEAGCLREAPPRTAAGQQRAAIPITAAQLQPGDLIFHGEPAHHVLVFLGKDAAGRDEVIEAPHRHTVVNIHPWAPGGENYGALLPRLER
ncbi:MAG: C40 family peptidase [Elusimicrobia bacterium]|nr:C40 family peptidase [Elusimicrobiota bacterium]